MTFIIFLTLLCFVHLGVVMQYRIKLSLVYLISILHSLNYQRKDLYKDNLQISRKSIDL